MQTCIGRKNRFSFGNVITEWQRQWKVKFRQGKWWNSFPFLKSQGSLFSCLLWLNGPCNLEEASWKIPRHFLVGKLKILKRWKCVKMVEKCLVLLLNTKTTSHFWVSTFSAPVRWPSNTAMSNHMMWYFACPLLSPFCVIFVDAFYSCQMLILFLSSIVEAFIFVLCSKVYFANRAFENSLDFVLTALLSKMYLHRIFTIPLKSFSSKVASEKEYPAPRIGLSFHSLVGRTS